MPGSRFLPLTVWLVSSCLGITFIAGIWISLINLFYPLVASTQGDLAEVTRTTSGVNGNTTQNLYIQ